MARFIFPVGGTAESVRAQLGAVGPAPDPTTTPPPGVGDVLTWDGSAWVPGAGGGGGGTVIADGGTLSGTYTSDVLCVGNVSLAGNVTVKGKLIIENTLTNPDGYELTVLGDLFGRYFSLTRSDTSQVGGNLSVDGDFWFYWIEFYQSGGTAATIRVGGDLIGSAGFAGSYISAYGLDDSPGANVYVYGDLNTSYIDLDGGNSVAGNAGQGGTLVVWGDLTLVDNLSFAGGEALGTGFNAGSGGYVEVYGDMNVGDVYGHGGGSTDGNAGNGGDIDVGGSMTSGEVELYGGDCTSDNESFISGQGGDVSIDGNFTRDGYMNLNGGDRYGNLSAPAQNQPPDAGNLFVRGNFACDVDHDAIGGSLYHTGASIGQAGRGGNVEIHGNASFEDDVELNGGDAQYGDAGDGGNLDCWGNLVVEDDLELEGGDSANGNGGNGGNIEVYGNLVVDSIRAYGNTGNNGNGGSGGNVNIDGTCIARSSIDLQGGSCVSTNEVHYAGSGGSFYVDGNIVCDSSLYLRGGNRSGATTVAGANGPANAGLLTCDGNVFFNSIYGNGGNVLTDFPNAPGGDGAQINISGSLRTGSLEIIGGSSVGANGGRGGELSVIGGAVIFDLNANGGDSNNSVGVGGDAAVNGAASPDIFFPAGIVSNQFALLDGVGAGSAPTDSVNLYLGHFCTLGYFNATNRPDVRVRSVTGSPFGLAYLDCTLKVANLPTKQTLNNNDGSATGNVGPLPIDTLFIAGGGVWHAVVGAAI